MCKFWLCKTAASETAVKPVHIANPYIQYKVACNCIKSILFL